MLGKCAITELHSQPRPSVLVHCPIPPEQRQVQDKAGSWTPQVCSLFKVLSRVTEAGKGKSHAARFKPWPLRWVQGPFRTRDRMHVGEGVAATAVLSQERKRPPTASMPHSEQVGVGLGSEVICKVPRCTAVLITTTPLSSWLNRMGSPTPAFLGSLIPRPHPSPRWRMTDGRKGWYHCCDARVFHRASSGQATSFDTQMYLISKKCLLVA